MKEKTLRMKTALRAVMLILMLGGLGVIKGYAYDFSAVCSTGQTLYYTITNTTNHYVRLTYPGTSDNPWGGCTKPSGLLTIPSTVIYNGISYSLTSIGWDALYFCDGITSINIPNTVSTIWENAFYGCRGLASITISSSVASIGDRAFAECNNLSSIILYSETPPSLGCATFSGVNKTIPVRVPCGTSLIYETWGTYYIDECGYADSWSNFKNIREGGNCNIDFADATVKTICVNRWDTNGDGEISISEAEAVTDIENFFATPMVSSFDELKFFKGLTFLSQGAFRGAGLTSIIIPNTVNTIGSMAFQGCSSLTSIKIPDEVTSIESYAFDGCTNLTSITIPYYVSSIGYLAFNNTGWYNNQSNGIVYLGNWCLGYKGTKPSGTLTIRSNTRGIASNAFCDCSALTSISLPNGLKYICSGAFASCSNINTINLPNSVLSIGYSAFANCTSLTSINLGNSLTFIGNFAFNYCSSLTSVVIPNSVTTIELSAFSQCSNLVSVSLSNSLSSIESGTFENCTTLTYILIPNSVKSIGRGAFSHCSSLSEIIIPNSAITIGEIAFWYCNELSFITIPNSVTSIGNQAFDNCNNLETVVIKDETPPTLGNKVFNGTTCSIYVPCESLDTYKTATNWSDYANKMQCWMEQEITGYGNSTESDHWTFIASPVTSDVDPTTIDDLIAETAVEYDFYRLASGVSSVWENYKAHTEGFVLENGQGYLYANKNDVDLIFKGEMFTGDYKDVNLVEGWNLVGNPYGQDAYIDRSYYKMNAAGSDIETVLSSATAIPVCTGVVVQGTSNSDVVRFTKTATSKSTGNGCLQMTLAKAGVRGNEMQDMAIVSFDENAQLGKFIFNEDHAKLYIPQGSEDFAIAHSNGQGEMPLNFRTKETGTYTINFENNSDLKDAYLIDKFEGAVVDLNRNTSYTFIGSAADRPDRFVIRFNSFDASENSNFAYQSGNEIIVNGNGELQVFDVMGRVIAEQHINGVETIAKPSQNGVYIFRLNEKNQKIVVR